MHLLNASQFLINLQREIQEINEYSHAPLAKIQSGTTPNHRLFDVLFVFENHSLQNNNIDNLDFTIHSVDDSVLQEYPFTIVGKTLDSLLPITPYVNTFFY